MNRLTEKDLSRLSMEFRRGLANNYAVFGIHAFRKHSMEQEKRGVLNASLWDVMSTGLSRYKKEMVESRVEELKNKFYLLMDNDDFVSSITYGPSNVKKVHHRFLVAGIMFERVLSAHTT